MWGALCKHKVCTVLNAARAGARLFRTLGEIVHFHRNMTPRKFFFNFPRDIFSHKKYPPFFLKNLLINQICTLLWSVLMSYAALSANF